MDYWKLGLLIFSMLNIFVPIILIVSTKDQRSLTRKAKEIKRDGCLYCHSKEFFGGSGEVKTYPDDSESSRHPRYEKYYWLECKKCHKVYANAKSQYIDGLIKQENLEVIDQNRAADILNIAAGNAFWGGIGCTIIWMVLVGWIPLIFLLILLFDI